MVVLPLPRIHVRVTAGCRSAVLSKPAISASEPTIVVYNLSNNFTVHHVGTSYISSVGDDDEKIAENYMMFLFFKDAFNKEWHQIYWLQILLSVKRRFNESYPFAPDLDCQFLAVEWRFVEYYIFPHFIRPSRREIIKPARLLERIQLQLEFQIRLYSSVALKGGRVGGAYC